MAVPPVEGRSSPDAPAPPDDLARAGARWGNAAQIALLGRVPPETGRPFTFAVIGDAEPGRFPWERLFLPARDAFRRQLRSIQDRRPAFILQLSDFVSRGTAGNYRGHVRLLGEEVRLATYRGVPHILSGGGGSPLYPMPRGYPTQKMAHFILVEAGPGGIVRETVVPLGGPEFALRF